MCIYDLVKNEARLFKYGSGTGTNFSAHPRQAGEALRRRHLERPDELPRGLRSRRRRHQERRHHAPRREDGLPRHGPPRDRRLHQLEGARGEEGARAHRRAATRADFNGEAYHTISGQNSNNSVRVTDEFMQAALARRQVADRSRAPPARSSTRYEAQDLWQQVAEAAWACADPGVQYDTHDQPAGTRARTPAASTRRTRAPSTCSSTTRPATSSSLNLTKFLRDDGSLRRRGLPPRRAASSSSRRRSSSISRATRRRTSRKNSHDYRPLGLGYANLGTLLMLLGVPYDSRRGPRDRRRRSPRSCAATPTRPSAEMAATKGPFAGFAKNREPMLRVMRMHRDAAYAHQPRRSARPSSRAPRARTGTRPSRSASSTATATRRPRCSRRPAPSACSMDCDTTGIEPDFALVKFKKLAGGGYFKIVNQSVPSALKQPRLLARREVQEIVAYVSGTNTLLGAPHVNRASLKERGLTRRRISPRSRRRSPASSISTWRSRRGSSARRAYERLGRHAEGRCSASPASRCSSTSASRDAEIDEANDTIVGRMTIEGAPLPQADEHYAGVRLREPLRQDRPALPRADVATCA